LARRGAIEERMTIKFLVAATLLLAPMLVPALARADVTETITVDGRARSYTLHVPPDTARDRALVLVLHGGGGSADSAATQTGFSAVADREGFVVVYPDGTDRPRQLLNGLGRRGFLTWNAGACCGFAMENRIDDVAFLRALVARLVRSHAIDPRRVYATGLSNGGMMAYRLACEASELLAAVAVVSGVVVAQPCTPRAPVAVLHIHGSADQNVPLAGGVGARSLTRTPFPPVAESIALWVRADGCTAQPRRTELPRGVESTEYGECRPGGAVTFMLIAGGGHSWPGGQRMLAVLDAPSTAFAATPLIWRFFAAHAKS
jgi:polyhydroxybutyrate depolymerase